MKKLTSVFFAVFLGAATGCSEDSTINIDNGVNGNQGNEGGSGDNTGGTGGNPDGNINIEPFNLLSIEKTISPTQPKMFTFSWDGNPDGLTYTVCKTDLSKDNHCLAMATVKNMTQADVVIDSLFMQISSSYFVLAKRGLSEKASNALSPTSQILNEFIQRITGENTEKEDEFGTSLSLSADGKTLAIGAINEDSDPNDIEQPNGNSQTHQNSGAVYIFSYQDDNQWRETAYLKASNGKSGDGFGQSLTLSADGKRLVVGATKEDSAARGIDDYQATGKVIDSGAVYIFDLKDNYWQEVAYIKASNSSANDWFGYDVALNEKANILAVGATHQNAATLDMSDQSIDEKSKKSGAVYVFKQEAGIWYEQAYLKPQVVTKGDNFGNSVSLDALGATLAIGAYLDSSGNKPGSGAAYIFKFEENNWQQKQYIKPEINDIDDYFGQDVQLNAAGNKLFVGAVNESSNFAEDPLNNSSVSSGAVYVFSYNENQWQQDAFIKAKYPKELDRFGHSLSINSSGSVLAVGASMHSRIGEGFDSDPVISDANFEFSGAAYLFSYDGQNWLEQDVIKSIKPQVQSSFGQAISLDKTGAVMAVSVPFEGSGANGQMNIDTRLSGAVYIY